jgi:hypothetical protein
MDDRILKALEKVKNKKTIIEEVVKPRIILPLGDGYLFDLPMEMKQQQQQRSIGKQKKPVVDMIESIMAKPIFDLKKVNDELMREYEGLEGNVINTEEDSDNPITNLGLL